MGTPDVHMDSTLTNAIWVNGTRNVSYHTHPRLLVQKCNENEDLPKKLYTLAKLDTFKSLQPVNVDEN